MENFYLNQLFDLDEVSFKEIFDGCRYPWEALEKLEVYFASQALGKILCPIPEGVTLVHPEKISIGKGSVIESGAYIRGPCIIGENVQIRHGAYFRGNVLVGNDCVIGHATELKACIVLNGVSCSHFNYVGDAVLGSRVNLGAGVKLANTRLDRQLISIAYKGGRTPTNRNKLGAILGDDVQIGCNAVTNPGTVMGKGSLCHPCQAIGGFIPPLESKPQTAVQNHVDGSSF